MPHHLEELKLIDCKINASLVCQLMNYLLEKSQLKSLSLVNVQHSPESFELVVKYLQESPHLKDLDLSWSIVMPSVWYSLMEVIGANRQLSTLNLSYNQLLEDQSQGLTAAERAYGGENQELSYHNHDIMENLKQFIKYSTCLLHLDLQQTGLIYPAIQSIGHMLTRAQSLRCIHLCGNEGVTESNIEWMLKRIKGRRARIPNEILPPGKVLGQIKVDDTE